jgi:hypothetical protein
VAGKVRWQVTMSLDGFIAGPDDAMDWIAGYSSTLAEEVIQTTGALLAGRRGYDIGQARGRRPTAEPGADYSSCSPTDQRIHPTQRSRSSDGIQAAVTPQAWRRTGAAGADQPRAVRPSDRAALPPRQHPHRLSPGNHPQPRPKI